MRKRKGKPTLASGLLNPKTGGVRVMPKDSMEVAELRDLGFRIIRIEIREVKKGKRK